jgi:hypothetical protein
MILIHGTTRERAEHLLIHPPNSAYQEPGTLIVEESFSMYVEGGPYDYGSPEEYALAKSMLYPDENGPVLLRVEVPDDIVQLAESEWFPIHLGLVQFDPGAGMEELVSGWAKFPKWIEEL